MAQISPNTGVQLKEHMPNIKANQKAHMSVWPMQLLTHIAEKVSCGLSVKGRWPCQNTGA